MKITYKDVRFQPASVCIIEAANEIIKSYQQGGFSLTLRQLYYQFVARDWIPNTQKSYKRLGSIINNARLAGHIDWEAIEDRTRSLRRKPSWESPKHIIRSAAEQYRRDLWADQRYRPEVWIEKDALIGVIEPTCDVLRIPCFSCRGYVSQSEMWAAGQRFVEYRKMARQEPIIIHLGDHDPSGVDMTRDIQDRMSMFVGSHLNTPVTVHRIALTIEQVKQFSPPPNPAKMTDSRSGTYLRDYGRQSWELDALGPDVLCRLIEDKVNELCQRSAWDKAKNREDKERKELIRLSMS